MSNTNEWIDSFLKLKHGLINYKEFENWVYQRNDTCEMIGDNGDFDYFDFDYMINYSPTELMNKLENKLTKLCGNDFRRIEVKWLLENILNNVIDTGNGCRMLSNLYNEGYDFIPIIFVGYDSEIDEPDAIEYYIEPIIAECKKLLDDLSNN